MEYVRHDYSGTEEDLPREVVKTRGFHCRALMIVPQPESHDADLHQHLQLHSIEMEAYGAVLRAFIVQADSLSWAKETLITNLRKELKVSDDEHREILVAINSDESIKARRELRAVTDDQKLTITNLGGLDCGFDPHTVGHVSRKKLRTGQSTMLQPPKYQPAQPSPAAISFAKATDDSLVTHYQRRQVQVSGKRGLQILQAPKAHPGPRNLKPAPDVIRILSTDMIIHEVEKIYNERIHDPIRIQHAKQILREHERSLLEAIEKLADGLGADGSDQRRYSSGEPQQDRKLGSKRRYYIDVPDGDYN